jgi:glucose/arabinose dehydrogenase
MVPYFFPSLRSMSLEARFQPATESTVGENGIENESHRANILEMNLDGSDLRIYAWGMRNPNGMAWAPGTNTLWTVVNERICWATISCPIT